MFVTKISPEFSVNIPNDFRNVLTVGQEVTVSLDAQGRLVITPLKEIRTILLESCGVWADRTDFPRESVDYVNELRRGSRLDQVSVDHESVGLVPCGR